MRGRIGCLCVLLLAAGAVRAQGYTPPPMPPGGVDFRAPPPPPPPPPPPYPAAASNRTDPQSGFGMSPPRYPESAQCDGLGGETMLTLAYDRNGRPTEVYIKHSSGHAMLDQAAADAARYWQVTPGLLDGRPVSGYVDIPVSFQPDVPPLPCWQDLRIDGVRLLKRTTEGDETKDRPARVFTSGDVVTLQLDFAFAAGSKQKQKAVRVNWYRWDDERRDLASEKRKLPNDGQTRTEFQHAEPGGWKPGAYEVEVELGGQVHGRAVFWIAKPAG